MAGNRAAEAKLAYYRQMTATAPRRYLKRFRLKYVHYIFIGDAAYLNSATGWVRDKQQK
ncbi:hypothetical protein WCU37_16830 [Serratia marcescens]|uniref:hypothetical protein n=1 Tax=Serratia TaxID=613 RepID=UPI0030D03579